MHSTNINTVIGTQKCVYTHSPVGKLEKNTICGIVKRFPLQQRFNSNSETGFSITVHYLPTFQAFEEGIVSTIMSFANSTAVATPFTRMPTIHYIESDLFIKTSTFKDLFKFVERNTHNLLIKTFSFWIKPFKILNRNISIVLKSHIGNFLSNLSKSVLNKIVFSPFKFFKGLSCSMTSFVSETLEFFSLFKNPFSSYPNIPTEICLFKNPPIRSNNRYGKAFAVNVNPEYVFSFWENNRVFFGEESNNLPIAGEPICLANPSFINEGNISLIIPVLFNRNSSSFSWIHSEFNKEKGFGVEGFTVSWNIELNSDVFESVAFASDNISFYVTYNLTVKGGGYFAF